MKKFAVFSGFLGSGKTTAMVALTKYYTDHYGKAAMISNDLGEGVTLADHRFARLSGVNAAEITDECICFCHSVLTEHLDSFYRSGCELVVSDIPGFGVGALEHVYHGLTANYPGRFELAPFTVLAEPRSLDLLRSGEAGETGYIMRAQLTEADLIVLSKCDLLNADEIADDAAWLSGQFPHAQVLPISAAKGSGLEELSRALMQGRASMQHPDIDYDGEPLQNAMDRMTEYYLQYRAQVCCNYFDGNAYLSSIARRVQQELRSGGFEIPHMKLLAWEPEGDFGKVDLLGVDRQIEITKAFANPCTDLAVVINASALCPAARLDKTIGRAVRDISRQYQTELMIFKKDCFNLGE